MKYGEITQLTFRTENRGSHHGQSDNTLLAYKNGEYVGHIDYSVYQGDVAVQMISVPPDKRKQGYGSALVIHLQSLFPDSELHMGTLTEPGAKLLRRIPKTVVKNAAVIAKLHRLRKAKAIVNRYQKKADAIHDKGQLSERDRVWFQQIVDRWNDLNDEIWNLENELRNVKPTKTLYAASQSARTPGVCQGAAIAAAEAGIDVAAGAGAVPLVPPA